MLVIQHADVLTGAAGARAVQHAAGGQGGRRRRAAAGGADPGPQASPADLTKLLQFFPGTVELPPLRHHVEDLRELVPFFLARLSQQGRVSCAPATMQLLQRHNCRATPASYGRCSSRCCSGAGPG
jgi:hypothetical protein